MVYQDGSKDKFPLKAGQDESQVTWGQLKSQSDSLSIFFT